MAVDTPLRDRILDEAETLVLRHGFSATTVDAVLRAAKTSKGAFFHHFPTKQALGQALVARYAAADAEILEAALRSAEAATDDPAGQLVALVEHFERATGTLDTDQPGCLFVSFIYEQLPASSDTRRHIVESIDLWRRRLLDKLEAASAARPPALPVDLPSLADQLFCVFEGAFVLARATGRPEHVSRQLAHLRHYLRLLFSVTDPP